MLHSLVQYHCVLVTAGNLMVMCYLCCCVLQALQAYVEGEKAAAAAAVTDGPLAASQAQLADVQVRRAHPRACGDCTMPAITAYESAVTQCHCGCATL